MSARELVAKASRAIDAGQYPQAEAACREALRADPKSADAWYLLAGLALNVRKYDVAEQLARSAISHDPLHPGAWHSLGMAQKGQAKLAPAVDSFQRALMLVPKFGAARNSLGITLKEMGRLPEAEAAFREAIKGDAKNAQAHHNLAVLLAERDDVPEAIRHYELATQLAPRLANSHSNLGRLYVLCDRRADAEARFRKALEIDPRLPEAHNNLGILLQQDSKLDEAFAHFDAALAARPDFASPHNNAGLAAKQAGQIDRARAGFARAMELDPAFADPHWNLGNLERDEGHYEAARKYLETAARRFPTVPMAPHSLGVLDLLEGRFASGWRGFTWREVLTKYEMHHPPVPPAGFCPPIPAARVESLDVVAEQGLGDMVFYARWAARLKEKAGTIRFHGDPRLQSILERTGAFDSFASKDAWQHTPGALEVRLADLPYFTGAERDIPAPLALACLPEKVDAMRARLAAAGPGPYLGLTWRAGIKSPRGYDKLFKEVPWAQLLAVARLSGATLISLQREPPPEDSREDVHDFSDINADLEGALALLSLLDEYVGVSNTNMHLRAGLGLPTRVLVPVPPEWRYGIAGERSPFFPRAKLYRQDRTQGWSPALAALAYDFASKGSPGALAEPQ